MSIEFQAFWEAVIGVLLLIGAAVLVVTNGQKEVREIYIFAGVLVLQSLPFLSAVAIAHSGELADQLVCVLAQQRGADRRTDRAAPGGDADGGRQPAAGGLRGPPRGQLSGRSDFPQPARG